MSMRVTDFCKKIIFAFFMGLIWVSPVAAAELVEDVEIKTLPDGYQIDVKFIFPMRYITNTNGDENDSFRIQLQPTNFQALSEDEQTLLSERVTLAWPHDTDIPLLDISYEGGDPERPLIHFLFSESVSIESRSSVDLRSLIVKVKTRAAPQQETEPTEEDVTEEASIPMENPQAVISDDKDMAALMKDARVAMTAKDYNRAVQLYTKILRTASGASKKQAQEFLGLARERKKQFAHAKAEYEKFLLDYPDGPDADRVRQRLAGLVTATKKPKARLKDGTVAPQREQRVAEKPKWDTRYFGNISQRYFYDQTTIEGGEKFINRSDLSSDIDLNARWRNEDYDIRTKFSGGYRKQFIDDEEDEDRISSLSFEAGHKPSGLFGKIGRQTRRSGGVLGRFDGVHASYDWTDEVKFNAVFGLPVESTRDTKVDSDKHFFGISVDLGTFKDKWDFNAFAITQDNDGLTDRRAIGGEVRYYDPVKSFFALVDYDVFYSALNIFLFNGHWNVSDKTTLNFVLDRRKSPLLTTNNAIQGQGVSELSDLTDTLSESVLKSLAEDRSATSTSGTVGITHTISDDMQVTGEVTASEITSTPASGGVEAIPGTGKEYFYITQLITNNTFIENDSIIYGLRYSDAQNSDTYTATLNGRFPYTRNLRFIPKLRIDYRTENDSDDTRLKIRPIMRVDYRLRKWVRLEAEIGGEWVDETASGMDQSSKELFITVGYRANF